MIKFRFLPLFLIMLVFITACTNRKKDENAQAVPLQDTLGLAAYQKWKMENEMRAEIEAENKQAAAPVRNTYSSKSSSSRSNRTYHSNGSSSSSSSGAAGNSGSAGTSQAPAPAPQRKGMSHTAKGAIVGAASGAVIGAVANKKDRLGGGVVGGVIGAATGAGVGVIVDKKERKKNGY